MIKTLLGEVKEFKKESILTPLCMILEVIFETFIPLCSGLIVDKGVKAANMPYVWRMGAVMLALALGGLISGCLGGIFGARASTGFARNLRKKMYDNIQTFSFSNIDKFSTAGLVTRLTTDVTNIQNAYQMILRMAFRAPVSLIVAMAMAYSISPKIANVYLIAVIFLALVAVLIMKSAMKYFRQVFKKYDSLNESVQENTNAIRVVKAYVREEHEVSKFMKASENIYNMFVKAESRVVIAMPIMMFTVYACIISISYIGAHMISVKSLTTGELFTLLQYCMNILFSMMMLSMIFVMISMSMASAERIAEVINEVPDITNPDNPVMDVENGDIEFRNVDFSYTKEGSGEAVLKDINLHIKSGETIGIIGPTGSAKSSLVNLISRLYDVTSGELLVGGKDVKEYDLQVLRDKVAVVLQKNVLFSGTILDNLRWGNKEASLEECKEACKIACADEFIENFENGYDTYIERGGNNVSGGQKQRLCIARALLKKPKILILDDSTSAVDTATDAKIRNAFLEKIPGTTKIIIAQRVSSIQAADRIIVMEEGRINAIGSHDELIKTCDIYKDVYESQAGGSGDFDEEVSSVKAGVNDETAKGGDR